jgi:hypothetical protein
MTFYSRKLPRMQLSFLLSFHSSGVNFERGHIIIMNQLQTSYDRIAPFVFKVRLHVCRQMIPISHRYSINFHFANSPFSLGFHFFINRILGSTRSYDHTHITTFLVSPSMHCAPLRREHAANTTFCQFPFIFHEFDEYRRA